MKTLITLILVLFMSALHAQELTKDTYLAFKNDNVSALKSQITGQDVNSCLDVKDSAYTLLGLAIKMEATASLDYLIAQKGIDLDKACTGKTPLLYTAKYGHLDMMKSLLAAGADPKITNKGRTLLDYAKKYKQQEIVDFLLKA